MMVLMLSSLACSLFTGRRTAATPTADPYIFKPVTTPLKIEPDSLPNAQTGVEYEVEIRVSDNVTPISEMGISKGKLPAGLNLVFERGKDGAKISGVPKETGTFTFMVFVACFGTMVSGQAGGKEYTIIVE
jgi:hypothetical protein